MNVNNKCQNLQVKNSKSKNSSKEVNASTRDNIKLPTNKSNNILDTSMRERLGKLSPFNDVEIKELARQKCVTTS